jgi:hypothetical protein
MDITKFNKNELNKIAKKAVGEKVKEMQAILGRVHRDYGGRPVPEVKVVLVREWRRDGRKISDSEATQWATLISHGTRIVLRQ